MEQRPTVRPTTLIQSLAPHLNLICLTLNLTMLRSVNRCHRCAKIIQLIVRETNYEIIFMRHTQIEEETKTGDAIEVYLWFSLSLTLFLLFYVSLLEQRGRRRAMTTSTILARKTIGFAFHMETIMQLDIVALNGTFTRRLPVPSMQRSCQRFWISKQRYSWTKICTGTWLRISRKTPRRILYDLCWPWSMGWAEQQGPGGAWNMNRVELIIEYWIVFRSSYSITIHLSDIKSILCWSDWKFCTPIRRSCDDPAILIYFWTVFVHGNGNSIQHRMMTSFILIMRWYWLVRLEQLHSTSAIVSVELS